MNETCPCCDRHCPTDDLHCRRGREHFGIRDESHERHELRGNRPAGPEEKLLVLLRKCGHFLHHSVGRDGDTAPLLRALTPEEKLILETLLKKCLKSWEPQHKAEPED